MSPRFYLCFTSILPPFNLFFTSILTSAQRAISNHGLETTVYKPLELSCCAIVAPWNPENKGEVPGNGLFMGSAPTPIPLLKDKASAQVGGARWHWFSMRETSFLLAQGAENGALDVRFGAPRFQSRAPQTHILKGFRVFWGKDLWAPQTQIQWRRIQRPILGPVIAPPIFALFKVKNWSNFFVFLDFYFQKSHSPCRKKRIFEKQAKKQQKKNTISKVKNWSNYVAQHTWTSF